MKKMTHFYKKIFKPYIMLPIITLFCLAGFIGSYVFPNTVLDTYVINMSEEEVDHEVLLPLSCDDPIIYELDTKGLSMRGIQVGINKRGLEQKDVKLVYTISVNGQAVSKNIYEIAQGDDLQFVYLPFQNYELCNGKLRIEFKLETTVDNADTYPALMANHKEIKDSATIASMEGASLKCSYIYTHKTYPFLYDFRILTFVFLAVSMTVCYPKLRMKGGAKHNEKN